MYYYYNNMTKYLESNVVSIMSHCCEKKVGVSTTIGIFPQHSLIFGMFLYFTM